MEWDLKIPPPWDLVELDPTGSGPAGAGPTMPNRLDLKLGGFDDFTPKPNPKDQQNPQLQPKLSSASAPSTSLTAGPTKRPRAGPLGGGRAAPSCSVEGCKADLNKCREYHRRHKVCEIHSKTPVVIVNGREQRFCQQCSRFHLLGEFDEAKRSCRKRLEGHNRRRRKPQPDHMNINSGGLFANHQGARFGSCPNIFPTSRPEPNWTGIIKSEPITTPIYSPLHYPHKWRRPFPFLQQDDPAGPTLTGNYTQIPLDSPENCALSLLSSPNSSELVQPNPNQIPIGQPLVSNFQFGNLGLARLAQNQVGSSVSGVSVSGFACPSRMEERVSTFLVSNLSQNGVMSNFNGVFNVGGGGEVNSSNQVTPHSPLPFAWQ